MRYLKIWGTNNKLTNKQKFVKFKFNFYNRSFKNGEMAIRI